MYIVNLNSFVPEHVTIIWINNGKITIHTKGSISVLEQKNRILPFVLKSYPETESAIWENIY